MLFLLLEEKYLKYRLDMNAFGKGTVIKRIAYVMLTLMFPFTVQIS